MSSFKAEKRVELRVQVADSGTEIFVSDARRQLVGHGVGGYRDELAPGIYQIRLRAGFASQDDFVVLPPDRESVTKTYPLLDFGSPVPLAATSAPASNTPPSRSSVMPPMATSGMAPMRRFHSASRGSPCGCHGMTFRSVG